MGLWANLPVPWAPSLLLSNGIGCCSFLQHQTSALYWVIHSSIQILSASPYKNPSKVSPTATTSTPGSPVLLTFNSLKQALFSTTHWLCFCHDGPQLPFWQIHLSFLCLVTRLPGSSSQCWYTSSSVYSTIQFPLSLGSVFCLQQLT